EATTRYAARRANRLIAVSKSTADDLARFYGVPGGRISVVHSGVDLRMRPQDPAKVDEVLRRLGIGGAYFLYVGRNHPRKNLGMLRRALTRRGAAASRPSWSSRDQAMRRDRRVRSGRCRTFRPMTCPRLTRGPSPWPC